MSTGQPLVLEEMILRLGTDLINIRNMPTDIID